MRLGLFFKEGRRRKLSPLWSRIVGVLVVLFAAVELYGAPFGFIDSFILRSLFVSFAITLTFICYTPIRTEPGQSENVPVPDILLACISLAAGAYMVLNGAELVTRWTGVDPLTPADWAVPATFVLLTREVTRRTVGPVLLGIILDGSLPEILWTAVVATAAVYSFASGLEGYLHGRLRFPLRLALMAAGVVFVWPDTWADLTGFAILGAVTAHQYAIRKNNPDPVCLAQPQGE